MKRLTSRRSVSAGIAAIALLALSGIAYAYFSSSGQGTSSVTAGTPTPFTVSAPSVNSSDLVPNTTIGVGVIDTVSYTVTNPSSGNQYLANVVISIGNTTGVSPNTTETNWTRVVGTDPACKSSDYSVGGQPVGNGATAGSGAFTIHPDVDLTPGQIYNGSVSLQMIDNVGNQNSCQGAVVPLYIAAS